METVKIEKLVHGGQGIGVLADGRKVFVWNALPGELLNVRITKKRRDYAEGIAEEIIEPSPDRIQPVDEAYLSTSPWQIMTYQAENAAKQQILTETFEREGVNVPTIGFEFPKDSIHYRNKMEYSFWGDDEGLHLALFHRASHGKRIITGSSIARPEIDKTANKICSVLNQFSIRAGTLKTVVVRCDQQGKTVAALFVKDESFPEIDALEGIVDGVVVYFSNPKSPASIITKELYRSGSIELADAIDGHDLSYDVNSFFQVNIPIFEKALQAIRESVAGSDSIVDMYAGVGTIGIPVGAHTLVELDEHNIAMAKRNASPAINVVQASTEQALQYIDHKSTIIFDPPRAGLHAKVIEKLTDTKPPKIVYLSCNPSTQARDIALLQNHYHIKQITGFNFFPRTPHIESLCILERK